MKQKIFEGTCTALVTPFTKTRNIDFEALQKLIERQVQNKVDAVLLFGSTGEGFALSEQERRECIKFVRNILPRQCKLIVGAGSNVCEQAIGLVDEAERLGADACLMQTPYFCRCSQKGIVEHFRKICKKINLPLIIYNIPSRSGVNIQPKTMLELAQLDKIVGLKEANGDIEHVLKMANTLQGTLPIYCGNDNLYQLFLALECSGTISVASNIFPAEIVSMWKDKAQSLEVHNRLFAFNNLLFCEPNPIPVKYALSKLCLTENVLRLPLTPLSKQFEKEIDKELTRLGVLS